MPKKLSAAGLVAQAQRALARLQIELKQIEQEQKKIIAAAVKKMETGKISRLRDKIKKM